MTETKAGPNDRKPKTSLLAVLSIALAILGLVGALMFKLGSHRRANMMRDVFTLTAPFAILAAMILGPISLVVIRRKKDRLKGTPLALAGTLLAAAAAVLIVVAIKTMPRSVAIQLVCGTNLKGLGGALIVYASENDDKYPVADKWCDLLIQHCKITPKNFFCSETDAILGESSYAMNRNVSGRRLSELPPDIVVLFDTNFGKDPAGRQELLRNRAWYQSDSAWLTNKYPGTQKVYKSRWNQFGGPEILTTENHGGKGCNILFNDGSVKFVKTDELGKLKWKVAESE